jgi:hypothetical protein
MGGSSDPEDAVDPCRDRGCSARPACPGRSSSDIRQWLNWDGTKWNTVQPPVPSDTPYNQLAAVAALPTGTSGPGTLRLRGPDHQRQQRVAASNGRLSQRGLRRHRPPDTSGKLGAVSQRTPSLRVFRGGFTRDLPRQYSGGGSATSTSTKTRATFRRRCPQCDRRRTRQQLAAATPRGPTPKSSMSTRKGSTKPICIPITAIKEGAT